MSGHGGKRAGAGRKPKASTRKRFRSIGYSAGAEDYELVRAIAKLRGTSVAQLVREAVGRLFDDS